MPLWYRDLTCSERFRPGDSSHQSGAAHFLFARNGDARVGTADPWHHARLSYTGWAAMAQLHAWRPGTRASLSWHEAQAFFTFRYSLAQSSPQGAPQQGRIYVLDAPEATLAWKVSDSKAGQKREKAAHKELTGMILTHTRLNLRTLSDAAEDLAIQVRNERWEKHSRAATAVAYEAMGHPAADPPH